MTSATDPQTYIGLMSGTSMDAIDTAVVNFSETGLDLIAYEQYPIDDSIRSAVRSLTKDSSIEQVTELDAIMGGCFAEACVAIIKQAHLKTTAIKAIGSHGQTVLHLPEDTYPRTLQIGDPNIICHRTGIITISDFRRMDIAADGQGAPLAPAFHAALFRSDKKNRVILNIGGIANMTILPASKNEPVIGFDTGPGNGLLDEWNRKHMGTEYDHNSHWASTGKCDEQLLEQMLRDAFYKQHPPKSTGRDYFNLNWLDKYLHLQNNIIPEDIQSTLLELTVSSIADSIKAYAPDTEDLWVCGGGAHNEMMLNKLKDRLNGITIRTTQGLGIGPDAVEAVTFAWLAKRRLENKPGNLPSVTGATKPVLMGSITQPL